MKTNFIQGREEGQQISAGTMITYQTLDDLSEYDVLPVQPSGSLEKDEELAAICVLSPVGHTDVPCAIMAVVEWLIVKYGTIDALPSTAIFRCDVSSLEHEILDHFVELSPFEAEFRLKQKCH